MKRSAIWFLVFLLFLSFSFMQKTEGCDDQTGLCEKFKPCQMLTPARAEKIIGQSVRLTQDTSTLKGDVRQCLCAYTAVAGDQASRRDINFYFLIERKESNPSAEQARQVLQSIRNDNAHDAAIIELSGIGDEAFQLGDMPDSHFILARKGPVILRLQIKQATGKTSLEELKTFAREVADRL
jgi:hypothetical protein